MAGDVVVVFLSQSYIITTSLTGLFCKIWWEGKKKKKKKQVDCAQFLQHQLGISSQDHTPCLNYMEDDQLKKLEEVWPNFNFFKKRQNLVQLGWDKRRGEQKNFEKTEF